MIAVAVAWIALAQVYVDMGNKAQAKAEYQTVLQLPASEYNDQHYKATAQNALKDLDRN
jgi:Tfp pilus assembly protein PilF